MRKTLFSFVEWTIWTVLFESLFFLKKKAPACTRSLRDCAMHALMFSNNEKLYTKIKNFLKEHILKTKKKTQVRLESLVSIMQMCGASDYSYPSTFTQEVRYV